MAIRLLLLLAVRRWEAEGHWAQGPFRLTA